MTDKKLPLPGVGFLEPHLELHTLCKLNSDHVIVDREDWLKVVLYLSNTDNKVILKEILGVKIHPLIKK